MTPPSLPLKSNPSKIPSFSGWKMALDRAPQFFSVILIFSVPLLTQTRGLDPIYPKQAVTRILVSFLFAAWVLSGVLKGKVVLTWSKATFALAGLLIWIPLTLAFSPWKWAGLDSLTRWEVYPLWYILLTFTCLESWKAENILVTFLAAGAGTSLWALAQALGIGGGDWLTIVQTQFNGRVTAGLGNPDFLAGYLLLVLPLAFGLFQRAAPGLIRWFWATLFCVSLTALVLTGSKAGWIGFVAGVLVYFLSLLAVGGFERKWARTFLLGVGLVVLTAFLPPMSTRLRSEFAGGHASISFRWEVWKAAGRMILNRPIEGTGFGTFEAAFPNYRPGAFALHQVERSYQVDYAHNWIMEWAAETGVVGLSLLLWFWFAVISQWWRLFRANAIPRALGAGVFAAFAAIAVDNFFDVNSGLPSTLVPLLFLTAFPVALSSRFHHLEGFPIRRMELDLSRVRIYLLPFAALAAVFALQQMKDAFQGQWVQFRLREAVDFSARGKMDEALEVYGQVLKADPVNLEARYFEGSAYAQRNEPGDAAKALVDFMEVERVEPDYVLLHFKKASALEALGRPVEAKLEMRKAMALDPALIFQDSEFLAAAKLADQGDFSHALSLYQKLVFDYPTCVPALVNQANCLARLGRLPEAKVIYGKALGLDPENKEATANLKSLLAANGRE